MDPIFTPQELADVHAYVRPLYLWAAVKDVVTLGTALLILAFAVRPVYGWSERAAGWLDRRLSFARRTPVLRVVPAVLDRMWRGPGWGAAILFAIADLLLYELLFLPVTLYFDYFHPLAHGLSNYTPAAYAYDLVKQTALGAIGAGVLAFGLFGVARRLRAWWAVLGVVAGALMLAAPMLDPYRGRLWYESAPLQQGPLRQQISALMAKARIEVGEVRVEKTSRVSKTLQAYFAGQGPTRAIVLNDVLVEKLASDEVLAAVAHEAGHVREPRWPRRAMAALSLAAFLYLCHLLLRRCAHRGWFGCREYGDVRALPLLHFAFFVMVLASAPFSAAWSRGNERAADQYALQLTGDPGAFRRMLVTAARLNKLDPDPPRWLVLRGLTHPSIRERLEHAARFEKQAASGSAPSPSPAP